MSPQDIIQQSIRDEVILALSASNTILLRGKKSSIKKWAAIITEHKSDIVSVLEDEYLYVYVKECCSDFAVKTEYIIDHFLSVDDEKDIIHGVLPKESLSLGIKLWIEAGMPHQSGKSS